MANYVARATDQIVEQQDGGLTTFCSTRCAIGRRVLFINSYGGQHGWNLVKRGSYPSHHLWGCVELAQMGYEIGLVPPLGDFTRTRPLPHDLKFLRLIRSWLRRGDIVYCGHNNLFWLPLLKNLFLRHREFIGLLYAREPLHFARAYSGIIGLTPAGTEAGQRKAARAKVIHAGWGVDFDFFPQSSYCPERFLSCGKTGRDHATLIAAVRQCDLPTTLICPGLRSGSDWPASLEIVNEGGTGVNVPELDLIRDYYSTCVAALIILDEDPEERTAVGFTNLIEAMALGRPVIVTKTGALPRELDVERAGCGLHVPPNDPEALADAMRFLAQHPAEAEAMGQAGRRLCEKNYNVRRYASDLHEFFKSI